ncbi:uncharacterized protein LOC131046688 [Cryptomeria japonica]|uniref:uncharacterized protein LOC131046688 n=1 Tax=Cryptomeria japonica TaxID=3369 RepID=UPI0027DAAD93|nr:uncharacterized protein LOC131046688 [Cryptomeria japonica]
MTPIPGYPLILYIFITTIAVEALLEQLDDEGKERAIYYINRTLVGCELNYSPMEKACLAVIFYSQKLQHYKLSHTVKLICKIDPFKYLLSKTTLIGRMAKWVMLLSKFDIQYVDRKSIKGLVIADQLEETPLLDAYPLITEFPNEYVCIVSAQRPWKLFFDGSHTQRGIGTGFLIVTPQGDLIPKSFKQAFPCTNNIAEYEAFIISLKITIQWNISNLLVYGDSQPIIRQTNDEYQTKDDKLLPYKRMVDDFKSNF